MVTTYELNTITQAVEIGTTLWGHWFRGHSATWGALTPKIFREQYLGLSALVGHSLEFEYIERFKQQAPAFSTNLPQTDDHLGWLFLMQHHGTPTRLLDWTKSVLVALYFTVERENKDDGELWALYPTALNECSGIPGIPFPRHKVVKFLANEALHRCPPKLAEEMKLKNVPEYPIAIEPPRRFPRVIAQLSTFTIHPPPHRGRTIPDMLTDEKHLVRYIVPSERKKGLLHDLSSLGIHRATLFQDLDALSKTIIEQSHHHWYSDPLPPHWDSTTESGGDMHTPETP